MELTPDMMDQLTRVAERSRMSLSETLSRALGLYDQVSLLESTGCTILVRSGDGLSSLSRE